MIRNVKSNVLAAALAIFSLLGVHSPLLAQGNDSKPVSLEEIKAKANYYRDARQLLADPDASVRLAAINEMIRSSDPGLRSAAFEAAFSSGDEAIRSLAVKERLLALASFVFVPEKGKEAEALAEAGLQNVAFVRERAQSESDDVINIDYGSISISGQTISVRYSGGWSFSGTLRHDEGGKMTGVLGWKDGTGEKTGSVPVVLMLN